MVETQETAATLNIVDSMEEQSVLEQLLDEVKPPYRPGTQGMHYLLKTAFRYPPLKYGSRFGTNLMPSYFYASEKATTALVETAYYRFVFLDDMQEPYPGVVDSQHCLFSVSTRTEACLDLMAKKFNKVQSKLADRMSYLYCQAVGDWAVNQRRAELIRFQSARVPEAVNVAVAEPSVIRSKAPTTKQSWICRTSPDKISFNSREAQQPHLYLREQFLLDGKLPRPA